MSKKKTNTKPKPAAGRPGKAGRPARPEKRLVRITGLIPRELLDWADQEAARNEDEGRKDGKSGLIRRALESYRKIVSSARKLNADRAERKAEADAEVKPTAGVVR